MILAPCSNMAGASVVQAARPLLVVVTGATASGKTALALDLAEALGCDIISADSRQIYRDLPVGTAAPTAAQLARVRHHMVGTHALDDEYSAAAFEADVMRLLPRLFVRRSAAVMCGGSMMYVDAVVRGIDDMPSVSTAVRARVDAFLHEQGPEALLAWLELIDPDMHRIVDRSNMRRVAHAVEVTLEAGVPYSSLRTGVAKSRPFDVLKLVVDMPRQRLFDRINARVQSMVADGLLDEVRRVYPLRGLNSLNTVGYKELFTWLDGSWDLDTALSRMAKNTRVYAKKQLTWLARDPDVHMLPPDAPFAAAVGLIRRLYPNINIIEPQQNHGK